MEISYSELRSKIVVNLVDGRKLGHIVDLIFDLHTAKVLGIVVPGTRNVCSIFRRREDIFISYHNICKIGEDTILVELNPMPPQPPGNPSCRPCSTQGLSSKYLVDTDASQVRK